MNQAWRQLIQSLIQRLPGNICVIDADGNIAAVNENWLRFAQENSEVCPNSVLPGSNYFAVCEAAQRAGDRHAAAVLDGLRGVLDGRLSGFEYQYPCNSPEVERWFRLDASPLDGSEGGAVICHTNITASIRAAQLLASGGVDSEAEVQCMCSACKRVRAENGQWQEVEDFVYQQFGERFSHGICQECAERIYPEFVDKLGASLI